MATIPLNKHVRIAIEGDSDTEPAPDGVEAESGDPDRNRYTAEQKAAMPFYERLEKCRELRFTTVEEAKILADEGERGGMPLELCEAWRSRGYEPNPIVPEIWRVVMRNRLNRRTLKRIWAASGREKESLDSYASQWLAVHEVPMYAQCSVDQLRRICVHAKQNGEAVVPRLSRSRRRRDDQYASQMETPNFARPVLPAMNSTFYDGATDRSFKAEQMERRWHPERFRPTKPPPPPKPVGESYSLEKREELLAQKEKNVKERKLFLIEQLRKTNEESTRENALESDFCKKRVRQFLGIGCRYLTSF